MKESVIYKLPMVIIVLALLAGIFCYSLVSALESNPGTERNFESGW
ncbi:MAG: hypothetical protein OIN66_13690 [Candidatus Methanoperedens sp.]|nr:hypothetical protein [Candidatus Methanoperedens sp.]